MSFSPQPAVNPTPPIPVVCALIERDGRVLIAQRAEGRHLGLKWELPGGKVEPGEEPAAALIREIREELGCEILAGRRLRSHVHRYDRVEIDLIPFLCELQADSEEPHPHEHDAIEWAEAEALLNYDLAPADVPVVESFLQLRKPGTRRAA